MAVCVGCGLDVNTTTGLLEVQIRADSGIACDNSGDADDGLFLSIHTSDPTNCFDLLGTGTSADPLRGNVVISPNSCNSLTCQENGLYAPCLSSIADIADRGTAEPTPFAIAGPNNTYVLPSSPAVTITNTTCSDLCGRLTIQEGGLFIQNLNPGFLIIAHMEVQKNGGGWVSPTPDTGLRIHNNDGANTMHAAFNNIEDAIYLCLASTEVANYEARMVLTVIGAAAPAGTIEGTLIFQFQWELAQSISCTD